MRRQKPQQHRHGKPQQNARRAAQHIPADHADNSARDRGAGINMFYKNIRSLSCHDIAEHTPAHTGEHTDEHEEKGIVLLHHAGGSLYADHRKYPESRGIAPEHEPVIIFALCDGAHGIHFHVGDGKQDRRGHHRDQDIYYG